MAKHFCTSSLAPNSPTFILKDEVKSAGRAVFEEVTELKSTAEMDLAESRMLCAQKDFQIRQLKAQLQIEVSVKDFNQSLLDKAGAAMTGRDFKLMRVKIVELEAIINAARELADKESVARALIETERAKTEAERVKNVQLEARVTASRELAEAERVKNAELEARAKAERELAEAERVKNVQLEARITEVRDLAEAERVKNVQLEARVLAERKLAEAERVKKATLEARIKELEDENESLKDDLEGGYTHVPSTPSHIDSASDFSTPPSTPAKGPAKGGQARETSSSSSSSDSSSPLAPAHAVESGVSRSMSSFSLNLSSLNLNPFSWGTPTKAAFKTSASADSSLSLANVREMEDLPTGSIDLSGISLGDLGD